MTIIGLVEKRTNENQFENRLSSYTTRSTTFDRDRSVNLSQVESFLMVFCIILINSID